MVGDDGGATATRTARPADFVGEEQLEQVKKMREDKVKLWA